MPPVQERYSTLPSQQEQRYLYPQHGIQEDYDRIYNNGEIMIGYPKGARRLFTSIARENTVAIAGIALGDEGKGRFVDGKIQALLARRNVREVVVVRYQGGNNAGHTIEANGKRIDLHLVPSFPMYANTSGIIDNGVIVHDDLQHEVEYVEEAVGDIRGRLIVSSRAILATDVERAEEAAKEIRRGRLGGTGRGIGPAYKGKYDRTSRQVDDLMDNSWREMFGQFYQDKATELAAYGIELSLVDVPDFPLSHSQKNALTRKVGLREEFLDRLESFRTWLIERGMVENTFPIHLKMLQDMNNRGILFEGAQALGLHPWLGTYPDVTSSDTSVYGINSGTGLWRPQDIKERIGVMKMYTSSVGVRRMPTHIGLPDNLENLPEGELNTRNGHHGLERKLMNMAQQPEDHGT